MVAALIDTTPQGPLLIGAREAGLLLGVHERTIKAWIRDGRIKAIRMGDTGHYRWRIPRSEIERIVRGEA